MIAGKQGALVYAASSGPFSAANSATDIFYIKGADGFRVRVLSIEISGSQTTAGQVEIILAKRSTANSGGTSASPTKIPFHAGSAAASASVLNYTANPTTGTLVGNIKDDKVFVPATTTEILGPQTIWDFSDVGGIPLNDATQGLAVNLAGATVTGDSWNINVVWSEEALESVG